MRIKWTVLAVIIGMTIVLAGCGSGKSVDPASRVTEFTKPAVVRVASFNAADYSFDSQMAPIIGSNKWTIYDGGTGSGSIIAENGYIVTNAHVVEASHLSRTEATQALDANFFKKLREFLSQRYNQQQIQTIIQYATKTTTRSQVVRQSKVILPGGDVYGFDIKTYGAPIGQGKDVAIIKIDAKNLPVILIDETDSTKAPDHVIVAGYPGAADLRGFLDDKSQLVSSYTSGTISAKKTSENGPILQMDASINPGNSGGPVFNNDGKMVGIATASSSGGINWAIPVSTVLEYARQANSPINQPGPINRMWQDGLELSWQEKYSAAIPKFEEVHRLYSQHYGVSEYIAQSQSAIAQGKDRGSGSDLWVVGVVVIAAAGGGWFWYRRKVAETPQPDSANPPATPPAPAIAAVPAVTPGEPLSPVPHAKRGLVRGLSAPFSGQVFEVGDGPLFFGSDPLQVKVLFPAEEAYQSISPLHALLIYDPMTQSFLLEDGPSETGTFLASGEKVGATKPARLLGKGRFYLGCPEFAFEVDVE